VKQLIDFEFQIYYKKNNKNSDADTLSRQSDYKEVKTIYAEILHEDKKETLIKDLAATFNMKNTFLTDKELIKVYYNSRADRHLEVKCIEDLI